MRASGFNVLAQSHPTGKNGKAMVWTQACLASGAPSNNHKAIECCLPQSLSPTSTLPAFLWLCSGLSPHYILMLVTVLPLDSCYIHAHVPLQITFLKDRNHVLFLPKIVNYEIKLAE